MLSELGFDSREVRRRRRREKPKIEIFLMPQLLQHFTQVIVYLKSNILAWNV
jgi:hypothetical protein